MDNPTPHLGDDARQGNSGNGRATVARQSRLSPIWIIPIIALLIGLYLLHDHYSSRGVMITLTMETADGIEAGTTLIRSRNVEIGRVESVRLSDDLSEAVMTARIQPQAQDMLNDTSQFWVVKPRIGREGISGLSTVLSGAYIQLAPGDSEQQEREFQVRESPPVTPAGTSGMRLNLVSQIGNSMRPGDPVSYQGYTVGRVDDVEFRADERTMHHTLFIEAPYDTLVTEGTRFWSASGIDFRLDANGAKLNLESLEALVGGGVTFGVPDDAPMGANVEPGTRFTLYSDEESAREGAFDQYLEYVLMIDDSVRGLAKGAPVEFRGIRAGSVVAVPWKFTVPAPDSQRQLAIPVLIRIEPQRLEMADEPLDLSAWQRRFQRLFDLGLRATLKNGNLLTGAMFVDLKFVPDANGDHQPARFADRPIFPSVEGEFAQIQAQITALLDKMNQLEIEPLVSGLDRNLQTSEKLLSELTTVTRRLDRLLSDPELNALGGNLNDTLEGLQGTLEGVSTSSPAYQELMSTVRRADQLLRELEPLAKTLNEDPRSLLFENKTSRDPVPRAPNSPRP